VLSQLLVNVGGSGDEVVRAVTVKGSTIYIAANLNGDGISLPSFDGKIVDLPVDLRACKILFLRHTTVAVRF